MPWPQRVKRFRFNYYTSWRVDSGDLGVASYPSSSCFPCLYQQGSVYLQWEAWKSSAWQPKSTITIHTSNISNKLGLGAADHLQSQSNALLSFWCGLLLDKIRSAPYVWHTGRRGYFINDEYAPKHFVHIKDVFFCESCCVYIPEHATGIITSNLPHPSHPSLESFTGILYISSSGKVQDKHVWFILSYKKSIIAAPQIQKIDMAVRHYPQILPALKSSLLYIILPSSFSQNNEISDT